MCLGRVQQVLLQPFLSSRSQGVGDLTVGPGAGKCAMADDDAVETKVVDARPGREG